MIVLQILRQLTYSIIHSFNERFDRNRKFLRLLTCEIYFNLFYNFKKNRNFIYDNRSFNILMKI